MGKTIQCRLSLTTQVQHAQLANAPLNTDGIPAIEYLAPMNPRFEKASRTEWFVGSQSLDFIGPHLNKETLAVDSYLFELFLLDMTRFNQATIQNSHLTKAGRQNRLSDESIKYESLVKEPR